MSFRLLSSLALVAALAPSVAEAKKGLYFGFNLGGALVSGQTASSGLNIKDPGLDPDYRITCVGGGACPSTNLNDLLSVDRGTGFGASFNFGYNILGFVGIEMDIWGSGGKLSDYSKIEGQGGIGANVRFFPAQLFVNTSETAKNRWWDPYVFVGAGVYVLGYNPDSHQPVKMVSEGRVWFPAAYVKYGLGCDFYVVRFLSLGVDFAFAHGFMDTYRIDNKKDIRSSPVDGPAKNFSFLPSFKLTFHFLGD